MTHSAIHKIAANCLMVCGDAGLLHSELYDYLTDIDDMIYRGDRANCDVASRQSVAVAIAAWKLANPGKRPCGSDQ